MLDGVDTRILARDHEQGVDAAGADRLRFAADLVEREVAAHRARMLDAEVAVAAGVDARVADVERRVHAHRLAVVAAARLLRPLAHRVHERIRRRRDEVQEVEEAQLAPPERRLHHLGRHLREVGLNLFFRIFQQRKHGCSSKETIVYHIPPFSGLTLHLLLSGVDHYSAAKSMITVIEDIN